MGWTRGHILLVPPQQEELVRKEIHRHIK
jgi:hypothetical protein